MPKIELIQGDCLEKMKDIPDKSIDMILCDLPYGTTACKWDTIIPFEPLWEQYKRIIKDRGAIVLTASQPFTSALVMSQPKMFRFAWVWDKRFAGNFALVKYQPMKTHEDVLVFSVNPCNYHAQITKREIPIKAGANKCLSDSSKIAHAKPEYDDKVYENKEPISIISISNRSDKRGLHPTQKPVALFEYLIKTYTNENDLVLDNCIGSGTTAIACLQTNRNFIGIEIEPKYVEIANKRISDYKQQLKLELGVTNED